MSEVGSSGYPELSGVDTESIAGKRTQHLAQQVETVSLVQEQVERQADRQVRLQRRVERHHQQLDRRLEAHVRIIGPHQDRAAIFGLADLEEGCLGARLDEITGGDNNRWMPAETMDLGDDVEPYDPGQAIDPEDARFMPLGVTLKE